MYLLSHLRETEERVSCTGGPADNPCYPLASEAEFRKFKEGGSYVQACLTRFLRSADNSLIALAMLAMIAVPAGLALHAVHVPDETKPIPPDATPYGYTVSLLLFIIPIIVIGWWFVPQEGVKIPKRAFWWTILVLFICGSSLDFFFANRFFTYTNHAATLGVPAPALGGSVPIEEYVFYLTGFIAVLLIYVWLDEYWLVAYNVPDYPGEAKKIRRLLQFHPTSLALGLVLIGLAITYKRFVANSPGFPGYFTFLVAGGIVPAVSFFPSARPFINWRALSLTLFMILLISMFWEATLAVPYGWWGYQPRQMMGLFIGAWGRLPIEAVCVWIAATYATVIVFEVVKIWQASERTVRDAFLGVGEVPSRKTQAAGN